MEEIATPYRAIRDAGLDCAIVSIDGGEVPIDGASLSGDFFTEDCQRFTADAEAQGAHAVLVYYYVPDCEGCAKFAPTVATLADEYAAARKSGEGGPVQVGVGARWTRGAARSGAFHWLRGAAWHEGCVYSDSGVASGIFNTPGNFCIYRYLLCKHMPRIHPMLQMRACSHWLLRSNRIVTAPRRNMGY